MAALLTSLGEVFTESLGWVADIATMIVDTPILLITTGFLVVGAAVGLFGRMLSKG